MSRKIFMRLTLLVVTTAVSGASGAGAEQAVARFCDDAEGWRICVDLPPDGDARRATGFQPRDYLYGPAQVASPWLHWSGNEWEDLVLTVWRRDPPPVKRDDQAMRAWAGFWDAAARKQEIAAGSSRLSTPLPFKVSTYVDGQGRRWPHAVRHTRMLAPWIVRTEHMLKMPLAQDGLRLELSFHCTSTTGNCRKLPAILSSLTWERLPAAIADTPVQLGVARLREDGVLEISLSRDLDGNSVHGYFEIPPGDPRYARERAHLGDMVPGREVPYFANEEDPR